MRKLVGILAGALALGIVQVASAADMPVKAPLIVQPVAPNWTGFYLGADIGGARMSDPGYTFADPGGAAFASCGPCGNFYDSRSLSGGSKTGWLGGLHLGYNWQVAPTWLVGVEADATWTDLRQSVNTPLSQLPLRPAIAGSNLNFETNVRWLASLRGRLGLVQNNWLFYATGGFAWADIKQSANASCPPPAIVGGCVFTSGTESPFSTSTTKTGFVVGGGLEWQMPASRWRARAEYLYYGFNGTSGSSQFVVLPGGGPLPCRVPVIGNSCSANYTFGSMNIQTVRLGLSYAF